MDKKLKLALINAFFIGSGGFLGALARYGLAGVVHARFPLTTFPYGTATVNLLGCLVIGALAGVIAAAVAEGLTADAEDAR